MATSSGATTQRRWCMRSSLEYDELAAAGRDDDEIHHDQHQIVVPAVGAAAPEPRLPHEDLLLDRAEHDQDQPDRGELCEESEGDADATDHFRAAQEYREAGARTDALRPLDGVLEVVPSTIQEHDGDHEAQEEETGVAEWQDRGKQDVHVDLVGREFQRTVYAFRWPSEFNPDQRHPGTALGVTQKLYTAQSSGAGARGAGTAWRTGGMTRK